MSKQAIEKSIRKRAQLNATMFAALGDETRLQILALLGAGQPQSISELTVKFPLTRQAVTKHLRVLEAASFVEQSVCGRERRFVARRARINDAQQALQTIAQHWDDALSRLKSFVESDRSVAD